MKLDCQQQDDAGWWVCIVLAGYWPEKLEVNVVTHDEGEWQYEEIIESCKICGQVEYSY